MSKQDKFIDRLRNSPKNVRFQDIDILLRGLGFEKRVRGSHHIYSLDQFRITVPFRKPFVKPVYVKLLLEVLEQVERGQLDE